MKIYNEFFISRNPITKDSKFPNKHYKNPDKQLFGQYVPILEDSEQLRESSSNVPKPQQKVAYSINDYKTNESVDKQLISESLIQGSISDIENTTQITPEIKKEDNI